MIDLAENLDVDASVISPADNFVAPIEVLNDSRLTTDKKAQNSRILGSGRAADIAS
jgi:hypothetical protein